MRIGLLGCDEITLAMAEHGIRSLRATSVSAFVESPQQLELIKTLPGTRLNNWERLLEFGAGDVVLVARNANEDRLTEQMRQLAQAGLTLAVSHPVCNSMLVYHELDMVRAESQALLIPLLFGRWHPGVQRLSEMVRDAGNSPLGEIEQIAMERMLAQRGRTEVLASFARDVDLLRYAAGDLNRLSAIGQRDDERAYSNLVVNLTGANSPVCHWHVVAAAAARGARIVVSGTRGQATLHMPDDADWRLDLQPTGAALVETKYPLSQYETAWSEIERLEKLDTSTPAPPADQWLDAARAVELTETIERSLRRGKTVELQNETYSDIATFKGTMSSLGCGLVMISLFLLFVSKLIQTIAKYAGWDNVVRIMQYWPYALVVLLTLFLAVQLFMKLALAGSDAEAKSDSAAVPSAADAPVDGDS